MTLPLILDTRSGVWVPELIQHVTSLPARQYDIRLELWHPTRTNAQNKYLFGVVYPMIRRAIDDSYTLKELHIIFGAQLWLGDDGLPRRTSEMTTVQFWTDVVEPLRMWAAQFLHLDIPDPTTFDWYRDATLAQ